MLNRIIIDPGKGWGNDEGIYETGAISGPLVEVELIDTFIKHMKAAFDAKAFRHFEVWPTRHRYAFKRSERFGQLTQKDMFISIHLHTDTKLSYRPYAKILTKDLAHCDMVHRMSEIIDRWGRTSDKDWDGTRHFDNSSPLLCDGAQSFRVELFDLTTFNPYRLALRLGTLGQSFGEFLSESLIDQNLQLAFSPYRIP